jgi:hypothetical protein
MGTEFFQAEGQTDMKLIVAFRDFVNAPKNYMLCTSVKLHMCVLAYCHYLLTDPRNFIFRG